MVQLWVDLSELRSSSCKWLHPAWARHPVTRRAGCHQSWRIPTVHLTLLPVSLFPHFWELVGAGGGTRDHTSLSLQSEGSQTSTPLV